MIWRVGRCGSCVGDDTASHATEPQKQRRFTWLGYAAESWDRGRRIIARPEFGAQGRNPRFVVTSPAGTSRRFSTRFTARGDMENRIKEQHLGPFSDRSSCHSWWATTSRVILSACDAGLVDGNPQEHRRTP
jgi:hypothetical protein